MGVTMNLKIALVSATAVGLLMATGAAYAGGGNYTYLNQAGDNQLATVNQSTGYGDSVGTGIGANSFYQNDQVAGYGGNKLQIDQNSTVGIEGGWAGYMGTGSGYGNNTATGHQSGWGNNAEIDQGGSNSTVDLEQNGGHNGWVGPGVSGDPWYNSHYANIILQDWTANYSHVSLTQNSDPGAAKGNFFSIGQGGYNNSITANQSGTNSGPDRSNDLWVRQGTAGPDLWWPDGFGSPSWVQNSTINVTQTVGVDAVNYAALAQSGGTGGNTNNAITLTQTGGANAADASQIGSYNTFTANQTTTDTSRFNHIGGESDFPLANGSEVNALAAANMTLDWQHPVTQIGYDNTYLISQAGSGLGAFGTQNGTGNFLSAFQYGTLNDLFTNQTGDNNTIDSWQQDDSNLTIVAQNGSGNHSNTVQSGTSNLATVNQ